MREGANFEQPLIGQTSLVSQIFYAEDANLNMIVSYGQNVPDCRRQWPTREVLDQHGRQSISYAVWLLLVDNCAFQRKPVNVRMSIGESNLVCTKDLGVKTIKRNIRSSGRDDGAQSTVLCP